MRLLIIICVATLFSVGISSLTVGVIYLIDKLADFMDGKLGIEGSLWFLIITLTAVSIPFMVCIMYLGGF